ncbi:General stress protein 16U [Fundidesulfovibrio magnetotacticus]|uniref:General stress protein 16U n=1 Tax=Fundidesulfovibrio magnetotacticus TaxID=2730080 RepID=A0A6V8LS54_9BACT|nr:TerD family protein [Fundidesulfovibrio magnetotacticus]GFK95302.1 General stress protein 16U [Fundidesulfovibrio magnetotacticus]
MAVSLVKGQKISLAKEARPGLTRVIMGLGWDAAKKKGIFGFLKSPAAIDLDASCALFDAAGDPVDVVWFRQLKSKDGSIVHTGDNLTGEGEGDDEQVIVDLSAVPSGVKSLVFTVNSFRGQTFDEVENAYCRMVDASNEQEIARYQLSGGGRHTAMIMAKVYRHNGEWKMHAIGEPASGQTIQELVPGMRAHL